VQGTGGRPEQVTLQDQVRCSQRETEECEVGQESCVVVPEDPKRIANLKHCGLWDSACGLTEVPGPGVDAAADVLAASQGPIATVTISESAAGPAGAPGCGNPLAGLSPTMPNVDHGGEKASESEVEEKPKSS
jgi:hypothetical protein